MMTRQHFEKVASLLKEFKDEIPQTTFEEIVMEFGDLFLSCSCFHSTPSIIPYITPALKSIFLKFSAILSASWFDSHHQAGLATRSTQFQQGKRCQE